MPLMMCWKEQHSELRLKLAVWALIAGFVLSVGALITDYSRGPNAASQQQFEALLKLEQLRNG